MTRASARRARLLAAIQMGELRGFQAVKPATVREILASEAKAPMRAGAAELPNNSLWGDSHKQTELF